MIRGQTNPPMTLPMIDNSMKTINEPAFKQIAAVLIPR